MRKRVGISCWILLFAALLLPPVASAEDIIQQLSPAQSTMHFEMTGSMIELNGKFNRFNGTLVVSGPQQDPKKVVIKVDASQVNLAPIEQLPYFNPEAVFTAIPNPVVTFTSTKISPLGPNNFKIEGVTKRGAKEWNTSFQAVRRKSSSQQSEYYLSMRGPVSSFASELPPAFKMMQQNAALECTLAFKKN